jgi:hypothetical protein
LSHVQAGADDEVVGEAGDAGEIEDADVFGLLILRGANGDLPSGDVLRLRLGLVCTGTLRRSGFGVLQRFASSFIVLWE